MKNMLVLPAILNLRHCCTFALSVTCQMLIFVRDYHSKENNGLPLCCLNWGNEVYHRKQNRELFYQCHSLAEFLKLPQLPSDINWAYKDLQSAGNLD